jgi:hypothetical protein
MRRREKVTKNAKNIPNWKTFLQVREAKNLGEMNDEIMHNRLRLLYSVVKHANIYVQVVKHAYIGKFVGETDDEFMQIA